MKHWLLGTLILGAISPPQASATSGVKWLGDRLGLTRPVEELSGAAERRRTSEARTEAEVADNERKEADAELARLEEEFRRVQDELHTTTDQFNKVRADFYQAVAPIRARLFQISEFYWALTKNEQDLASTFLWLAEESDHLSKSLIRIHAAQENSTLNLSQQVQLLVRTLQKAEEIHTSSQIEHSKIELVRYINDISSFQNRALLTSKDLQADEATWDENLKLIADGLLNQNRAIAKIIDITNANATGEQK